MKKSTRWPSREEFFGWGLRECEGENCRLLVNPAAHVNRDRAPLAMCVRCRRRWLDRYWQRQRDKGAAGGGNRRSRHPGGRGHDQTLGAPTPAPPSKNVRTESRRFEP